ncbi:hypothetical protein D1BOALGB6SA_7745 [Olavius sp. associated proteobacterium Delta 1]|nr:hypothetical protein D1BOALGB6SA_7745 [Olavius sp. associated proteobacterium Delta 1]
MFLEKLKKTCGRISLCIGSWLIFGFIVWYHHLPVPSIMID